MKGHTKGPWFDCRNPESRGSKYPNLMVEQYKGRYLMAYGPQSHSRCSIWELVPRYLDPLGKVCKAGLQAKGPQKRRPNDCYRITDLLGSDLRALDLLT